MSALRRVRGAALPLLLASGLAATAGADALPVACQIPGVALADVRTPFDLALERSGEAVVTRHDRSASKPDRLLLRMPGCTIVPLADGPLPPGSQPMSIRPGGARLVASARHPDGAIAWWYSPAAEVPLAAVTLASGGRVAGQPILSDDGGWAAWVQQRPGSGRQTWHARDLAGADSLSGDASALGAGSYEVIGFDRGTATMTFARNLTEILDVDARTGRLAGPPLRPRDVASQPGTFRRLPSGWFAWDAYRDDAPWRAVWSVGGRAGRYEADWSKLISHASVNPSGTHAVLSLETRFGRIPVGGEAVVLVRLADAKEIFRKRLPRFSRAHAVFLGDAHLAWTEEGGVVVARVPE